jgi:uncharacterized membrane protein YhaH (DUF805 family)
MARRPSEALIRSLGFLAMFLCMVGAVAGIVVILVRVPVLADTKLDRLFGTLQGVAVSLLFAIAALLINLTLMLRRATRQLADGPSRTGA